MDNIVLNPQDVVKLKSYLQSFTSDSGVQAAILVSRSGFVITRAGEFGQVDPNSLAVISAAGVSSTQALASTIGEKKFPAISYQGTFQNLHIQVITEKAFVIALAASSVTSSVVRLYARELTKDMLPIIERIFAGK